MHAILVLLRKDFAQFRRDRGALILTFAVPFMLIGLFGTIFGVNRKDAGPSAIPFAVVDASQTPASRELVAALEKEKTFAVITSFANPDGTKRPLAEADLRPLMRAGKFSFAVVLPADFTREDRMGIRVKFLSDPRNDIETQTVEGMFQKTLFTSAPDLFGASLQRQARSVLGAARTKEFNRRMADVIADNFGGERDEIVKRMESGNFGLPAAGPAAAGTGGANDFLHRLVAIDREQVSGKDVRSPAATRLVGGWAMQFLLFALVASATSLFHEKDHGIFQRILAGPVPRSAILWSKFLYGMLLGLLQLVILFAAGHLLYGIEIGPYLLPLVVVCLLAAASCSAFGMLLAALAKTPESARGLATMVILLMSAIGGAWFPTSFMPHVVQQFSRLTLVYWSMEGFIQVLWVHATWLELLPTLGIIGGIAALFAAVAWWRFNRGSLFT